MLDVQTPADEGRVRAPEDALQVAKDQAQGRRIEEAGVDEAPGLLVGADHELAKIHDRSFRSFVGQSPRQ